MRPGLEARDRASPRSGSTAQFVQYVRAMGHGTRRRQPHSALLRVALIAVAVPGVSAPAAAADATLAPTNDTQLDQAAARANFGHARRLDVTSRPRRRVLLRFRLRGAPGRAVAAAT